jgi:hypothetical protein
MPVKLHWKDWLLPWLLLGAVTLALPAWLFLYDSASKVFVDRGCQVDEILIDGKRTVRNQPNYLWNGVHSLEVRSGGEVLKLSFKGWRDEFIYVRCRPLRVEIAQD